MSVHLYPVPQAESELDTYVEPFLESTVSEEGLSADTQFLILAFGDSASEGIPDIEETIEAHSSIAEQALEIGQLDVASIDERRLNTFTTSLFFNLLEVENGDFEEILQSDIIRDEDERKIDYYLPRVIDSVSEKLTMQKESFETKLEETYPVELETESASEMHERLELDIVTEQTIMDFLLLAASSTEDRAGVRSLVKYIRENDIDSSGYLSGGSENVSGYKRVISISYNLNQGGFNDEFQTARNLYEAGATPELFRMLNEVDDQIDLEKIYNHESAIERLLTSQFAGNDREIAERLLRTINATRAVENSRPEIEEQFENAKEILQQIISETQAEIEKLEAHNERFDETKIEINSAEIDQFVTLIDKVENVDSAIAKYLLGFDREQRTSLFTTLVTRIENYRDELQSYREQIDGFIRNIDDFDENRQKHLATIEKARDEISGTTVEVELPLQETIEKDLNSRWNEQIEDLEGDLPVIDLDGDQERIEATLDKWRSAIEETQQALDEIANPVKRFDKFNSDLQKIEQQRHEMRSTLEDIQELMEAET